MVRIDRKVIVFILGFFISALIFSQEKQVGPVEKLREEILAVYQAKGESGLREFFKKSKNRISNKFIVDFAEAGVNERKEEWLKACEIMAEEKRDEKTLADVYYKIGTYFLFITDFKKAFEYYENSLPLYVRINDLVGKGNIFLKEGTIYYYKGDGAKALEMFEKALPFYTKTNDHLGQGNYYFRKAEYYFNISDNIKALEMYEKALVFLERQKDMLNKVIFYGVKEIFMQIRENTQKHLNCMTQHFLFLKKKNITLV